LYSLHLHIFCTRERAGHRGRGRSRRSRRGRIPRNDRAQPHPTRAPRVLRGYVRLPRAFCNDDFDALAGKDAEEGGRGGAGGELALYEYYETRKKRRRE
jgi:hypothetical protein